MPKKTERGDPLGFFNIPSVAKHQKNAGGPMGKKFLAVPKKIERWDALVSPGMVCYAEKQGKLFWSSSLLCNLTPYFVELSRTILVSSCG